jgi:hypothetical protein
MYAVVSETFVQIPSEYYEKLLTVLRVGGNLLREIPTMERKLQELKKLNKELVAVLKEGEFRNPQKNVGCQISM